MAFRVIHQLMSSVWPVAGPIEEGRAVSMEADAVTGEPQMRPTRRDDDPGIIMGLFGGLTPSGQGTVFSVGGEFAVTDVRIMGRTSPSGPDLALLTPVVGQPLTVSSQGDGMLMVAGVEGDPVVGRVTGWDGSTLRLRLNVEGVLPDTIPVQSWETMDEAVVRLKVEKLEQRRLAMAARQLALASAGVDEQVDSGVELKLDDGFTEWDY